MTAKEFVLELYPYAQCERRRMFTMVKSWHYWHLEFGYFEVSAILESDCLELAKKRIENERTT